MAIIRWPRPQLNRNRLLLKAQLRRVATGAYLIGLALALGACGETASVSGAEAPRSDVVYRLLLRAVDGPGGRTEWVDPQSGRWRIEEDGETIIYTGDSYITVSKSDGVAVRTGSPAYLGYLVERAMSTRPLLSYVSGRPEESGVDVKASADGKTQLHFSLGEKALVVATVEKTISPAAAESLGLFTVSTPARTIAREVRVGVPATIPVRAYWFGPSLGRRAAVFATEHFTPLTDDLLKSPGWSERDEAIVYSTFYELPSAEGKNSALPDQDPPPGELRVVSQPVTAAVAQVAIQAYNGRNGDLEYAPWPRKKVTLANGEQAVVIADRADSLGRIRAGFAVITETTLVNVVGRVSVEEISALAEQLRPL